VKSASVIVDTGSHKDILKIDLQLRLPQPHRLRSHDNSIAYQRPSIFSYFNYRLLMIIAYMACILNYAHKIAVFIFFRLILRHLDCCQRSVAVVKAASLAGSHVTTV